MSNVSLTSSVRQNLLALQFNQDQMSVSQNRLATGKRVNSAIDNATSFFTASSLQGRASDLSNLLDAMSNAQKTIEAANTGIEGIKKLVEQAQSVVRQHKATTDTALQTDLQAQYTELMTQITNLASDSGYNGKNLIKATRDTLDVQFNEATSSPNILTVDAGSDLGATGLGASAAVTAGTEDTVLTNLATAMNKLRSVASVLGSNLSTIQTRANFTKSMITTLKSGADNLVNADMNEESATLLSLQTRQQLSQTALSMANQMDQGVLRLFQ